MWVFLMVRGKLFTSALCGLWRGYSSKGARIGRHLAQRPLEGEPHSGLRLELRLGCYWDSLGADSTNLVLDNGKAVATYARVSGRNGCSTEKMTGRPCLPLSVG